MTEIAKLKSYTKSIIVDGINGIEIQIDWEDKKSGNYSSELTIKIGNKKETFQLYTATDGYVAGMSFMIPTDWLSEIPSLEVGTGQIVIDTYNLSSTSSAPAYSTTKNFTVYVPEEFKPEISKMAVNMRDINNYIVDYALYGLTFPDVNAIVTAHPTSPIKKYRITGGGIDVSGDFSYSDYGTEYNFSAYGSVVKTWSNTTFTLTVEDERGRKASITSEEFYVQPYNRPLISSLSAYRTDKDGITKADGDYIKLTVNAAASSIKDSNELDINSLECFINWSDVNDKYSGFESITNKVPCIFEADKEFDIKCTVRDKYMETIAYCNVIGDSKDFNIVDGGGGAAIGAKAEKGYFDVAYNSRFQKELSAKEEVSSEKGLVSTGTNSKGDFLSFGKAERIQTMWHYIGGDAANGAEVDLWGDFNDCTNIGVYCVHYNEDVSLSNYYRILNAPCEKAGTLRVFNATGNTNDNATEKYLIQEYVVYDGSATYRRSLSKIRDNTDVEWPIYWTFGGWKCFENQADYIVEEGTYREWTYRKWNSGIAECWLKLGPKEINIATAWGSIFVQDNAFLSQDYPFEFVEKPIFMVTPETNGGNFWLFTGAGGSTKQTPSISVARANAYTVNPIVNIYVKGKWK